MTPEERARAAAITDSIAAESAARRAQRTPEVSPEPTSKTFLYAAIFAFVAAAHIAGFIGYQHVQAKRTAERERQHAQELADAAQERATAERLAASLRAAVAPLPTYPTYQYKQTQAPQRPTPAPTRPRTEPTATKTTQRPAITHQPTPTAPDRKHEHTAAAIAYVIQKRGGYVKTTETEQVPGWEGRYRTTGEAHFYQQNRTPSPRRFEVLTQEDSGKITATDLKVLW